MGVATSAAALAFTSVVEGGEARKDHHNGKTQAAVKAAAKVHPRFRFIIASACLQTPAGQRDDAQQRISIVKVTKAPIRLKRTNLRQAAVVVDGRPNSREALLIGIVPIVAVRVWSCSGHRDTLPRIVPPLWRASDLCEGDDEAKSSVDFRGRRDGGLRAAPVVVALDFGFPGRAREKAPAAVVETPTTRTPFSPPNAGRDIRSLSVHPNGVDWLFVECAQSGDNRCDVMRYQLDSGRLYRYALPPAYSYTYARYSPKGNFIVMSRMPVYGDTEDELRRSLHDLQIVLMRADGSAFEVVPVAPGNKLSPFMSPDESRIAFWRSERLVPPGRRVRLLEFDIWEFDRRGMHEQPFAGIFKFVEGGQAQYISDDEILLESFGPSGLFSRYHEIYAGSAIYRMRRGNEVVPIPVVFDGIEHAQMPSMDRAGNLCLWGQTPRYGLTIIRISVDGRRQAWQEVPLSSEPWFEPRELVCDSSGRYIASIYRDHPVRFGGGTGGLAMLDIATDTWSTVPLPLPWKAEEIPVAVSHEEARVRP
ncbi:hypothetical protein WJ977_25135 [Achromobacter xylosoxidans]